MPKLRLTMNVPRPEVIVNLGNPDPEESFGWEGISLKTARHFFSTNEGNSVFQTGGSTVFQTEDNWYQYATEMSLATEEKMQLGSGQSMILFAGGGQGKEDEDEYGEGHATPVSNTYNKLNLMNVVQTQAVRTQKYLGGVDDDSGVLAEGFLKRAAQLDVDLGHIDALPNGDEAEPRWVKPKDDPPSGIAGMGKALEDAWNGLVGIEGNHDLSARFNPYSGVSDTGKFVIDYVRKLRGFLSDNVIVKSAKILSDAAKAGLDLRDKGLALNDQFGDGKYAKRLEEAGKSPWASEPSKDQATLLSTEPPWTLSGSPPWELKAKIDGGPEIAVASLASVPDPNQVSRDDVGAIAIPGGTVSAEGETIKFQSNKQGAGSKIELSGALADAMGCADEDEVEDTTADDVIGGFGKAEDYAKNFMTKFEEPVERAAEIAVDAVKAVTDLLKLGAPEDPAPLGLYAKDGITLATENRIYANASKGVYIVCDGAKEELGSGMVPRMLKAMEVIERFVKGQKEEKKPRSLGLRVRTDSDVDLRGDFFGLVAAVDEMGLVRIASNGVTDVTAKKRVAIGPRGHGEEVSTLEALGKHIFVGVRDADKDAIAIKDEKYKRAPDPPEPPSTTEPEPEQKPVWGDNKQQATDKISISANTSVQIEAGDFLVEVGGSGVCIGSRAATGGSAGSEGSPGTRKTIAIDTQKPQLTIDANGLVVKTGSGAEIRLQIGQDGAIMLKGTDVTVKGTSSLLLEGTSSARMKGSSIRLG